MPPPTAAPPPPIRVNRAPVLTLWAAVVAEALGHPEDTALTLGSAVAGTAARAKARRLGLAEEEREAEPAEQRRRERAAPPRTVRLLGREIEVVPDKGGHLVAARDGRAQSAGAVRSYLTRAFGGRLGEAREAMRRLAASLAAGELDRVGFRLYERFRPAVPEGTAGWGAKGELRVEAIERASLRG
jgi:hypothetical protein